MVYIDVRDRKFQFIFVIPTVVVAILGVLVLADQPDSIDIVAVMLVAAVVLLFVVYLVVQFVMDRMAE